MLAELPVLARKTTGGNGSFEERSFSPDHFAHTPRVLRKHPSNPVLTPDSFPAEVMYAFNPGAIRFQGEYLLMVDAATYAQPVVFWIARSMDGVHFTLDPRPVNWPAPHPDHPEDCVYDPRITQIGDEYIILYASSSVSDGVRVGIVKTKDFQTFERISIASEQGNRNGVLFPEKINGLYARLDRPFGNPNDTCGMWISYSPDLIYWGRSRPVMGKSEPEPFRSRQTRDGWKSTTGSRTRGPE
jgi:beta-1,4-mannooligosaccharide/beta-1,4-mannosyl-N-acetylglucosamine phosphorylase